ncbi:MAG: chorismate mutase [Rhodospirillales bacterium]|nr:chorismate mutase [Rhodospirillales bacterium]
MPAAQNPLTELRRQIDEIDLALHDLIMRRAEVVQQIATVKGRLNGASFHLPGREAEVVRRLIRRHRGSFPKPALVRIWRELISALIRLQGPFAVAVYAPDDRPTYWDLARDHYGVLTPIVGHASAGQVVRAVTEGSAAVGVLPLPEQDDPDPWWRALIGNDPKLPRVLARLPFGAGSQRGEPREALAIGLNALESTGHDRSLLVIETMREISRSALKSTLTGLGFEPVLLQAWREPSGSDRRLYLIEIAGFSVPEDPRLPRLIEEHREDVAQVWRIGGYAVPFTAEELGLPKRA